MSRTWSVLENAPCACEKSLSLDIYEPHYIVSLVQPLKYLIGSHTNSGNSLLSLKSEFHPVSTRRGTRKETLRILRDLQAYFPTNPSPLDPHRTSRQIWPPTSVLNVSGDLKALFLFVFPGPWIVWKMLWINIRNHWLCYFSS